MSTVGFWREIKQDARDINIQSNRLGKIGRPWYIFPDGNGPRGSFSSFSDLAPNLRSRDIVILGGVLREQAVAPAGVYDVTVIGAANSPRQATSGGVPTGGGACWLAPTSPVASTPLIELVSAGWAFENISFTPANGSAAIRLTRSGVVDSIDASHARISGCLFGGNGGTTQIGVEDNGGCGFVTIEDSIFMDLAGTALNGISTAAAIPLLWRISRNRFDGNTNSIAMSLTRGLVDNNFIRQSVNDTNQKVNLVAVAAQGSLNEVINNIFPDAAANVTIAKGYKPGTGDVWRNYVTDTAAYIVAVPA